MNQLSVFSSLILHFPKHISIDQCNEIQQILYKEKAGIHDAFEPTKNKAKSSFNIDSNILNKTGLDFKSVLKKYSDLTGFSMQKEISNSWFNIQEKGSVLKDHTHPLTVVAGVLFIEVNDQASPIYFHNPNPHINFTPIEKNTPYSFEWIKCIPEKGDLYLFPGWLKHGSFNDKNMCENRIVISFNAI